MTTQVKAGEAVFEVAMDLLQAQALPGSRLFPLPDDASLWFPDRCPDLFEGVLPSLQAGVLQPADGYELEDVERELALIRSGAGGGERPLPKLCSQPPPQPQAGVDGHGPFVDGVYVSPGQPPVRFTDEAGVAYIGGQPVPTLRSSGSHGGGPAVSAMPRGWKPDVWSDGAWGWGNPERLSPFCLSTRGNSGLECRVAVPSG